MRVVGELTAREKRRHHGFGTLPLGAGRDRSPPFALVIMAVGALAKKVTWAGSINVP